MYHSFKALIILTALLSSSFVGASGDDAGKKQRPKSQIIVRPGPPVKPTKAAQPNGAQKSDWGTSASAKR